LRAQKLTLAEVARRLGIGESSVRRILAAGGEGGCEPMRADDRRRPTKPIKIRLSLALRDHEESFQARSRLAVGETAETLPQPARDPVADTGHKA
jgi:hypothetical protein